MCVGKVLAIDFALNYCLLLSLIYLSQTIGDCHRRKYYVTFLAMRVILFELVLQHLEYFMFA